jgi:FAD/FMN-containing dehydrogenase
MKEPQSFVPESTTGGPAPASAYRKPNAEAPRNPGDPLVLPPGIDSQTFKQLTQRLGEAIGHENVTVISKDEQLHQESYLDPSKIHDMFHILDKQYFLSSAVIAPRNVPDVQAVMRLCNEFEVPVWPFSIGRNVGYGGAGPRVPGSLGMDMGRHMNKILDVNVDGAYALVEPGVTFFDLHDYLVENNLRDKLWIDSPDLGGGSVLGNTCDRGVGYTPYGDHWSTSLPVSLSCLES